MNQEKVVSVGLHHPKQPLARFQSSMNELKELVETAGGTVVKEISQKKDRISPATLLGKGKIEEIGQEIKEIGIKTVVFDDDLSPAQQKNIEKIMSAKIIDRTRLILDIFSQRARTREGQLQIELAQLNYLVPRLTGAWRGFSQQMGGIGMRGPGERKIEVERRYVRERIKHLKKEIEDVRQHRGRARENRERVPMPQVALVGYTNVGKSTLLNALVGESAVYADDKLFATLDPTTRRVKLPDGRAILFTDTVGFIQKLPTELIAAFRATLEEVKEADLLVHVVDGTAEERIEQQKTVLEVLESLGGDQIPLITVVNKIDQLSAAEIKRFHREGSHLVSARTGEGLKDLLKVIEHKLDDHLLDVTVFLPYSKRNLIGHVYRTAHILHEKTQNDGTQLRLRIDPANYNRLKQQIGNGNDA